MGNVAARLICADVLDGLRSLDAESVQTCITSPPYWGLRNYGTDGQIGLEPTPGAYVERMVEVFREVHRVLRPDGTLWVNIGDSFMSSGPRQTGRNDTNRETPGGRGGSFRGGVRTPVIGDGWKSHGEGLKPKNLVGIPWRLAFALQNDGWYLRSDIIWHKPNPMPESVRDRPTKAHEYVFLLSKQPRYFYDADAIREASVDPEGSAKRYESSFFVGPKHESGGYSADGATHTGGMKVFSGKRNRRSVWTVATRGFRGAHFAVFPEALVEPCVLAGSRIGDTVLDPFVGSGTTGVVALRHGRTFVGIDLNPEYINLAHKRIHSDAPLLNTVALAVNATSQETA